MSKKERLEEEEEGAPQPAKEAEPAADALWMFMFRFVLASGLLQHEEDRQAARNESFASSSSSSSSEDKGKRKKPTADESDKDKASSTTWASFLIEARLHDPRLTLHIAEFAGPKWVAENPYETAIIRKTEALYEWEKHVAAMREVKQGFEDLKQSPGEPLQRFEAVLSKHQLPSAMRELGNVVKTVLHSFSRQRPRFNIWKHASETREVEVHRRWISDWDWELRGRRRAASNALLHVDPWRDVRSPADVEGTCIASDEFLVERFQLWDAKFRFEDELRALNQARALKQVQEHGFTQTKKKKTPAAALASPHNVATGSLVIISDTETETEDNA